MQITRLPHPNASRPSAVKPLLLKNSPPCPSHLLLQLAVERVQIANAGRRGLPLRLHEIDFALKNNAAIDLPPLNRNGSMRGATYNLAG